jgi:ubiquinone/menaquinone biosynthesis C-methylase UbiE
MRLLPSESLVVTGPFDEADWNFRPVLGWVQRWRFRLILALLPRRANARLLEVGYGSGVFMPELARHCAGLYGVDVHQNAAAVSSALASQGVSARLVSGDLTSLPFRDEAFDGIVAVSSLEFTDSIGEAALELRRVLRHDGWLVLVTPGHSRLLDLGLRMLTGRSAKDDFRGRREAVIPSLLSCFSVAGKRTAPRLGSALLKLYTALRLTPLPRTAARRSRGGPLRRSA